MGRKKIIIKPILDPKLRNITYNKRKVALLKKAAELSMLCNSKMFLAFTDTCDNLIIFVNPDVEFLKEEIYLERKKKIYSFNMHDYPNFFQIFKKKDDLKKENDIKTKSQQTPYETPLKKSKTENKENLNKIPYKNLSKLTKIKEKNISLIEEEPKKQEALIPKEVYSESPKKYKKLSIEIPKNKELEQKMNLLKLMQTLPPKPNINHKDFKKIIFNSFFPPQILNNENIKEEFRINKENNCDNSKSEMKYSLDSTDSISKLKLSSQILSLSCEKNSEEKAFIYPTEEKNIKITGKRKFLDFIDENQTKQNVSRNDLNRMIKFYPNASSHQELLYPKRMTEEKERTSINSLEKTKIPKESINELVRNKKIKHSNTTEDFCEKFYSFESPQNRNDQYKGSPSFFSFNRKEEIFKKQKL